MIRWDDTVIPPRPDGMHSGLPTEFNVLAPLVRGRYQNKLVFLRDGGWELYVDPRAYALARACVYWGAPAGVHVNVIPLEI